MADKVLDETTRASLESECNALLPKGRAKPTGHDGSLWDHVVALIAAVKSGSVLGIWRALRDVIDHIAQRPPVGVWEEVAGISWSKLKDLLMKIASIILPLIL